MSERTSTGQTHSSQSPEDGDFHISELFFSRTDERGVIQSGNPVFQRVSGFTWTELLNAPHKLVRHDDMPKAVFWLLWAALKRGEPIGAYVKNRTKTGGHYWVFAVVAPIEGGYLSVRLKPTSQMFEAIPDLYASLRRSEKEDPAETTPEVSAQALLAHLEGLGFPGYQTFMANALTHELTARDQNMREPLDDRLAAFDRMREAVHDIFNEANELHAEFRRIEQIPINLRLQASRTEASGGPVSVISANYRNLAKDTLEFADRFTDFGKTVLDEISMGLFLMGVARLQREMTLDFQADTAQDIPIDKVAETRRLQANLVLSGGSARASVQRIHTLARNFSEDSRRMRRFVGGLDVTRVTCRIETGWLDDRSGGFQDIINKLNAFHEVVEGKLTRIDQLNDNIIARAEALLNRSQSYQSRKKGPKVHAAE